MDFSQVMLSAKGIDKVLEDFDLTYEDEQLKLGNIPINVIGIFNIPRKIFIDLVKNNLDKFPNVDTIIKSAKQNPSHIYLVEELRKNANAVITEIEGLSKEQLKARYGNPNMMQAWKEHIRCYDVDENSPIEDKIDYILRFLDKDIFCNNLFPINGQQLFLEISTCIFTNEQILQICSISDFTIEDEYCEWSIDKDDTLILSFNYNM